MADHLFENQTITSEGLNLIAHATAANAIVYTKALSNATVPADPSNVSSYSGKVGTIASASSSGNAARITLEFGNSDTTSSQAVKCVALMGRLQLESGDGVIVAYCSSGESSITLPSSSDAPCVTRFVVNLVMSASSDSTINVVESGVASLSDLSRFVSLHVAGDPTTGVNQTILGDKTWEHQQDFNEVCRFHDSVVTTGVYPETDNISSLGSQNVRYKAIYGETVNSTNVRTSTVSADEASVGSLHVGTILNGEIVSPDVDVELGSSISPEHTTMSNGISSVYIGSSNARFGSVYAGTVNGATIELQQVFNPKKATLTFKEDALLTDKDIVPANTTSDIQSCGRVGRPWKEMYVKNAIFLTKGTSSTTDNLIIYEDDGGINLDNSYTGGDAGIFWFRKRKGGMMSGATVSAGEFLGANPTISRASVSTIPESEVVQNVYDGDVVTIPVGGLILVIPNAAWMQNNGVGRKIMPGESITINDANKDAFFVSNWEVDTSGSSYARKSVDVNKYAYLKAGTYRALSYITYPANSQSPVFGAPILLQRVS